MAGTDVRLIGNTESNNTKTALRGNQNAASKRKWGAFVPGEAKAGSKLQLEGSSNYRRNNNSTNNNK